MRVLYQRCAGIDVHKDQVTVAVRLPGPGPGGWDTQVRKFAAFYGVLREMTGWLVAQGVTHVAMEATGVYTLPVFHALSEPGAFERVLVCNAAHVKNVPGRKTDAVDAAWLAELLECSDLDGSSLSALRVMADVLLAVPVPARRSAAGRRPDLAAPDHPAARPPADPQPAPGDPRAGRVGSAAAGLRGIRHRQPAGRRDHPAGRAVAGH